MRTADVLVIVIGVFFLVGVLVGIVVVYALSARRAHEADDSAPPPDGHRGGSGWPT